MAEGGDQPSSFIVVDVEGDLKDFEKEDSVYEFTKSYLENTGRSGGGKFVSGGFVKNPESQKLQYVVHYANAKSVDRVLKRHEHCVAVNDKNLVLTVRPCPPNLKKVFEIETPSSDGEGDGTGNSSNGESSPVEKSRKAIDQNSSGGSDIEVISRDGANGFTFVDVNKQGSVQHTGDAPVKPQTSETQPSARSADPPHSSNSSTCSTPESFDESNATDLDQWSRSIIVENVPEDMFPALRLLLENKRMGGGNIFTYERNPDSSHVLATFEEKEAADHFLASEKLNVMQQVFSVRRPLLLEEAKDTSTEELAEKDEETASDANSEAKDAAAAEYMSEETKDADLRKVPEIKDDEDAKPKNRVGNEENESKQGQAEAGRDGEIKDDEEQNKDKDEEKLRIKEKQVEDEQLKREIEDMEGLQNENEELRNQDRVNPNENEDEDKEKKEGKTGREPGAAADEGEDEEGTSVDVRDVGQGSVDEDLLNKEELSKGEALSLNAADKTRIEEPDAKPTPKPVDITDDELINTGFEPLRSAQEVHKRPESKDESSLNSDTSGSGPGSSLDVPRTPKSIVVKGVSSQTVDFVEVFLEDFKRGGGPIKEAKFSESDGELSVIFEDEQVAEKFLSLESFTILENKFYVLSPENKNMDEKQKSLEASLENQKEVDEDHRTVEVRGVNSSEVADLLGALMRNKRKGGGPVESESLDKNNGILILKFQDKKIADHFLAKRSVSLGDRSYDIRTPAREEPKREITLLEEVDDSKDREADERSRTVEVHGVQSKEVAENIVMMLENARKGGGPVETEFLSESTQILTVRFQDKKFAEHFIQQEVILVFRERYYIRPPIYSYTQPEKAIVADQKPQDVTVLGEEKSLDDDEEAHECRERHVRKLSKEPAEKTEEDKGDEPNAPAFMEQQLRKTADEEPLGKPEEESQRDSPVWDPCIIEVQGIPDNATDTVVTMIFENKRYCGIADVEVAEVKRLEEGRALITIKETPHAKALVEKGIVAYKNHTLVISRPSKPKPVEEVKESAQPPFTHVDKRGTPDEYATGQEQTIGESTTFDVSNIPEDMSEDTLRMIFENKRFGGGGEVTNIDYEKGRGLAVITLSDPEVAKRLVHQESVVFKESRLMVTKHIEEDRNQKPFPSRKRNNFPTSEKEQPSSSDRIIKVSNIPSGFNKDTLVMLFESNRYGGGDTDNIAYDQQKGTAVITFKDPEVAKTLIEKEVLIYKDNRLAITKSIEDPIESAKQDQASSFSSRMVDVSEIPPDMTTVMLTMLLENSSDGEIESIDLDLSRHTAVATFTDSVAADVLISDESVTYKGKRLSIKRHVEKKVDERIDIQREREEQPTSSNRMVFVSQIPRKLAKDFLVMLFENKRVGGGKVEELDLDPVQGTAVVTFEDPKIAASFIEKEVFDFKGQRMFITKHEGQAGDAGRSGKERDDTASAKEPPSPKYVVSGSFNTIKVSGLPKDTSKDMILMYFENKKRSGGGSLKVLEHQKEKGKVVIKFNNPADALEVCKKTHSLSGVAMKISALEMPLDDDVKSCAIEVKGLRESASENFLELYFENVGRSGGGPVEKVFLNKEAKAAIIVFEAATAVMGVMKKQPHKFDGGSVEVNVLEAAPPPPLLLSNVDTKRLLAKRLPPSASRESLRVYLDTVAKAKMVGWTQAVKPSTALLDFSTEPDYLSIRRLVCSKPFLGKMISIRRVPLTSSILVTGIPSSVTADFVAMYFENPRNGGTGDECKVKLLPDKSSAIVEFDRPDIIPNITSRRHQFEKKDVKVVPYYPWLGMISSSGTSGKVPAKTDTAIPTSITFTFDPKAVHFILKHQELQNHIGKSLEKFNCSIAWPSEGKGEVKLEFKGKDRQKPTSGWDVECEKVLQIYRDELKWKKENCLQEIWNDFKTKIQEHAAKKSKLIDSAFEDDQCEIQYMGLKKDTDEFEKIFKKIKGELEEELERKKKRISETMTTLRSHQLDLIRTAEFTKKLKHQHPDLELEIRQTEVHLCGMPDVVKKAKLFIVEKVAVSVQDSIEITESMSKVFAKEEARSYLMEQLHNNTISASWACNDRSIVVYALDERNVKEAVEVLKKEVVEVHVQLSKASEMLVQTSQWKDFIGSLYADNKSLEVAVMGQTVVAACTSNIADSIQRRLHGFIEKHAISEKRMSMELGVVDVIANYMKDELQKIEAELKECSGSIYASKDEPGFIIKGNETGVAKAEKDLQKLTDGISVYDHDIDRPGLPAYFYSRSGNEVLRGIQIRNKVSIQLDNTQSRAKPQAEASGGGVGSCRVEVRPGKFMIVMHGDITKFTGDAIVNAANEDLKHIGGVAAAIAEAAGFDLKDDCWTRYKEHGPLLPGQAYVSRAGKLPCKKVIHAVGPRWSGGHKDEENTLAMAVDSSLNSADEEGLKSIAMPSISTGIFGFPLDRATDIIVDAVKSYLAENSSTTVREVFFIDNDRRAVASLENKLKTIKVDGPQERPEGKKSRRVVGSTQGSYTPQRNQEPPQSINQRGSPAAASPGFQSGGADVIRTAEGVRITLVKGSISELQADVLVNTTGKELNLSHGNVSKSLLVAAGAALQSEVDAKKPSDFDYGQVVVTRGHKLRCNFVYHGSCRGWDNGAGNCERIVRMFMKNLLEKADVDRQKSIAIPAIGTGNLKIPHKIVAEIMYSEVEKFSRLRRPMSLLDVRFIVYDKDRDSIKAFEDKIRDLSNGGASRGAAAAGGSNAPPSRTPSSYTSPPPSASSMSSSGSDFSFDPVSKVIRIGTVTMSLKSGDITKERADAIVNSTNEKMDMTGGAVAKAILKAGGRTVEAECKRAKMSSRRVCVTSGGDLPARNIIHLVAGYNPGQWKDVIENTLEEAEDRGYKNIVFPMLGTGQIGQSASSMASVMVDAACEFYKTKRPKSLKEIVVCIFQGSMLDEFVDAVARKGASKSFINRAAGALNAASNWIENKVFGRNNSQDDSNPVDNDGFSVDEAGATQRTRTVAGPHRQSEEQREERRPEHLSRIILSIYALSQKAIQDVLKDIEEVIKEYIIDKILDSQKDQENIAKLNPEQVKRIKEMTDIFPVQIEVETGRLKRIRIRGPPMAVTSVMDQVHVIFQEAQEKEIKSNEEKWIANVAHWEYEDGSDFEKYPDEINAIIERAYRDKKPYAEWEEQDAKYRLTFQKMVEEFVTKSGTPPVKVRRVANDMEIPSHWEKMKNDEDLTRIPLNANDQEYKDVEKAVRATAQTTVNQIVKIERIQNKLLYKQYVVRKAAMDAANPGVQNEMTLWHGTGADTLESINRTGFNRSYCGKNAIVYGRGVYFAKNFSYSAQNTYSPPDANGYKHIYQCKVLTGEFALGNQTMIVPPSYAGSTTKKYDSTVDNIAAPTIFVIFYDTQAFPEYLVYFK